jgi:acetyltransferase-like isoleucine patch superfamily enzyme
VDNTVTIGQDVIIKPDVELHYVTLGNRVKIGKHTTIFGSPECQVIIGDDVYISPFCWLAGNCGLTIGNRANIGIRVSIFTDTGPNEGILKQLYPYTQKSVIIGDDAWICPHSLLVPGANLGVASILGANSFLDKTVPDFQLFAGSPAKYIKSVHVPST